MTHIEFEAEMSRLFALIPSHARDTILKYWKKFGITKPTTSTKREHVEAVIESLGYTVDVAATDGLNFYFLVDKIQERGYDPRLVILHEYAHCYFFAKKRFNLTRYRTEERHRHECERQTHNLSSKWLEDISKIK